MSEVALRSRPESAAKRCLPVELWRALLQEVPSSLLAGALVMMFACPPAMASQTKTLLSAGQNLLEGYPDGVRALEGGVLVEGPAFARAAELPALPLCAAADGGVTWVGTAPSGDLLRVEGSRVSVAHHFDEPLVTALALRPGGGLLVGTSTPAKVYRFDAASGQASLVADLKADYVWAILPEPGGFLAATGVPGKLLRVPDSGAAETVLDPGAAHVRCLASGGTALWAGTSGPGSLYRIEGGRAFLSVSLKQEEAVAVVPFPGGVWVAANEKSDPAAAGKGAKPAGNSSVLRFQEGKVPQEVRSFPTPVLCAGPDGDACLLGLADGRLLSLRPSQAALLARWEDAPVSALLPAPSPAVLTASPAALHASSPRGSRSYLSPVADFSAPARLGRTAYEGRGATLSVRAGNSPKPGPFWTDWVPADEAPRLPPSQFAQWRVELAPGAEVRGVTLPYRSENRPPLFRSAEMRPPGEVSVRMPSQLGDHLVREVHEKDAAFPGLAQSLSPDAPSQTYYLQGFRMVTWKVEDPDADLVRVTAQFRPPGSGSWFTLAERISDPFYVFDARSLPDGLYRLRLTGDDTSSNPEGESQATVLELPDFAVDNTPPILALAAAGTGKLAVSAKDGTAVQAVRYSVDGNPWQALSSPGWVPGSGEFSAELAIPPGGPRWITVEAVDPFRNRAARAWLAER